MSSSKTITVTEESPLVDEGSSENPFAHIFSEIGDGSVTMFDSFRDACDKGGVCFADNSGSTGGQILTSTMNFVNDFLKPKQCALWNSTCNKLAETKKITWRSTGGTSPENIFKTYPVVPDDWTSFTLLTDGSVGTHSMNELAKSANKTAHLPTILGIVGTTKSDSLHVSNLNVSVLLPHFSAATSSIVVLIDDVGGRSRGLRVRCLAVKGAFEALYPDGLPDLGANPTVAQFPLLTPEEFHATPVSVASRLPPGTIVVHDTMVGDDATRLVRLDELVKCSDPEVVDGLTEEDMEGIVRAMHSRGTLLACTKWLTTLDGVLKEMTMEHVRETVEEHSDSLLVRLLARLRVAETDEDKEVVRQQIREAAATEAATRAEVKAEARVVTRQPRRLIGAAQMAASALQQAGLSAEAMGRLSNRAKRADKQRTKPSLASLDAEGAPSLECCVTGVRGPSALVFRKVTQGADENTADFAIDFPLVAGRLPRNTGCILPDVLGTRDNAALDALERDPSASEVAIPIVDLTHRGNYDHVFKRLCIVFTDGLKLPHVWQLALAAIEGVLETQAWAGGYPLEYAAGKFEFEDEDCAGDAQAALLFLSRQIATAVRIPAHIRSGDKVPIVQALALSITEDVFMQDYLLDGLVTALSVVQRWGTTTRRDPTPIVQARLHRMLPALYVAALKRGQSPGAKFWKSIFATHDGRSGTRVVPVSNGQKLIATWGDVLPAQVMDVLARYAAIVRRNAAEHDAADHHDGGAPAATMMGVLDALVVPGTSAVIRACLAVLHQHLSSSAAIDLVAQWSDGFCAAEMDHRTVGSLSAPDTLEKLGEPYAWACRMPAYMPRFATRYGPSVLSLVDPETGKETRTLEPGTKGTAEHLAESIRPARARKYREWYSTNELGHFIPNQTTMTPLHRNVRDARTAFPEVPLSSEEFVEKVVQRTVDHGVGNVGNQHLRTHIRCVVPTIEDFPALAGDVGQLSLSDYLEEELRVLGASKEESVDEGGATIITWEVPADIPAQAIQVSTSE